MNRVNAKALNKPNDDKLEVSAVINGDDFRIGSGFNAKAYRQADYNLLMDPLIMVDHYTMTQPTFGAHPHAGLSAVSLILEDAKGEFNNQDSLGNDFDLTPGDLYWLKAGSGVFHDEAPREGATIHGLQVFVNIPAADKNTAPASLHVKAENMPIIQDQCYRVRVVLGEHNGLQGPQSPSIPMSIVDGELKPTGNYEVLINAKHHVWLLVISGELTLNIEGNAVNLSKGQSLALANHSLLSKTIVLQNQHSNSVKFAVFSAIPVKEDFIQKGPLVASSQQDMDNVEANLAAGKFGRISKQRKTQ